MNDIIEGLGLRRVGDTQIPQFDGPLNLTKTPTFRGTSLADYHVTVLASRDNNTPDVNGRTVDSRGVTGPEMTRGKARREPNAIRVNLAEALRTRFNSDAHMQPLMARALEERSADGILRTWRLNQGIFQHRDTIPLSFDVLVYDWDKKSQGLTSTWQRGEFEQHVRHWIKNPIIYRHAIIYQTTHGARFVFPLKDEISRLPGVMVSSTGQWSAFYQAFADRYLTPVWGEGRLDNTCDAPRLFRLPNVYRGSSHYLAEVWYNESIEPYSLDWAAFPTVARTIDDAESSAGVVHPVKGLVALFEELGLIRSKRGEVDSVSRYDVLCPLGSHDSANASSTSLLVNEDGSATFCCLHDTCSPTRGGRWRQQLQRKYPELWAKHIGGQRRQQFSPLDLRDLADKCATVLMEAFKDRCFLQDGKIKVIRENVWEQQELSEITDVKLWGILNLEAQWETLKATKNGGAESVQVLLTKAQVTQIYDQIAYELPPLKGFTSVPPMTAEGRVTRIDAGYCEETCLYFLPAEGWDPEPIRAALSRKRLTIADADVAARKLLEIFDDFPFEEETHRLIVLAMLLTIARRRTLEGPAPFFMVVGNQPSVGKGKLMQTALGLITGRTTNLTPSPHRIEEMEKIINASLLMGREYLVVDNIVGAFGSGGQVDAALTADAWSMRVLGESRMVDIPVRCFFGGTGNNVRLGGDTWRRVIPVSLTYLQDSPESRRGFRYADILSEARSRSSEVWAHVTTLLRAYDMSKEEEKTDVRDKITGYGSFELWSRYVREPVAWVSQSLFPRYGMIDIINIVRDKVQEARDDEGANGFIEHLYDFQLYAEAEKEQPWWTSREVVDWLEMLVRRMEMGDADPKSYEWARLFRNTLLEQQTGNNRRALSSRSVGRILGNCVNGTQSGFRLKRRRGGRGTVYSFDYKGPGAPLPRGKKALRAIGVVDAYSEEVAAKMEEERKFDVIEPTCLSFSPLVKEIPEDLEHHKAVFLPLTHRCEFLNKDSFCTRFHVDCEYPTHDGGLDFQSAKTLLVEISEPSIRRPKKEEPGETVDPYFENVEKENARKKAAPTVTLRVGNLFVPTENSEMLDLIRAQYEMRRTQAQIAKSLNEAGFLPPSGKRWTQPKVSALIKQLGLVRTPMKRDKLQTILNQRGSYASWTEGAPRRTQGIDGESFSAPVEPSIRTSSVSELLGASSIRADMTARFVTPEERQRRKEAAGNE